MMKTFFSFLFFLGLSFSVAWSWETDQFSLPKSKLIDIGEEISQYTYYQIDEVLHAINNDPTKKYSSKEVISLIYERLDEVYSTIGLNDGFYGSPISETISLLSNYPSSLISFCPEANHSIYAYSGFHRFVHAAYVFFSSSINMYTTYLGIDKLGHFFSQGYDYLEKYHDNLSQGQSPELAFKNMIDWGINTEETYFGIWPSGIYSNADLAANIAGFFFYQNLFQSITLDHITYPAILKKNANGIYTFSSTQETFKKNLLKAFITDHLNEALNPSKFEIFQAYLIQKAARKKCKRWKKHYPKLHQADYQNIEDSMNSWYGYNYGHQKASFYLSTICF